jgi:hypothetical protein
LNHTTGGACSVPFGNAGEAPGACELHDHCYSVCGSSRARCDLEFADGLLETCRAHYLPGLCLDTCAVLAAICSVGFCAECVSDSGCGDGKHCDLFGDCKNNLGNNAVCAASRECQSGICSAGFCAECVRDSQCSSSKHCNLFGDCVNDLPNGSLCTANGECQSGTCVGVCVGL